MKDSKSQIIDAYGGAWNSFNEKLDHFQKIDERFLQIQLQNIALKQQLETIRYRSDSARNDQGTQKYAANLSRETGTKMGRTLASFNYKIPQDLSPAQLYTLGLSYLKATEDEKAAVIFYHLFTSEETYKTAKNSLILAMIWYRIDNLTFADMSLDEVLSQPERLDTIKFQAQARLWKALIAKRLDKEEKAQFWLIDLIDHHPHSPEASWINPFERGHEY